jgi:hypothetical protein
MSQEQSFIVNSGNTNKYVNCISHSLIMSFIEVKKSNGMQFSCEFYSFHELETSKSKVGGDKIELTIALDCYICKFTRRETIRLQSFKLIRLIIYTELISERQGILVHFMHVD